MPLPEFGIGARCSVPGRAAGEYDARVYYEAAWLLKRRAVSVLPSVASLKALRAFARSAWLREIRTLLEASSNRRKGG